MIQRLRLADFAQPGDAYHFGQVELMSTPSRVPHCHAFHEIFWTLKGEGVHEINGQSRPLHEGQCVLIRPDDTHSLRGRAGKTLCLINVAFASRTWQYLHRRYFEDTADWFDAPLDQRHVDAAGPIWSVLLAAAEELGRGPRTRIKVERLLINLFDALGQRNVAGTEDESPQWLRQACADIHRDMAFAGGVAAFARLAGRSPEHLARQVRLHMGTTPTDIINDARLTYAATQLAGTRRSIIQIIADCGLENISHFYNLFNHHFGCTPRQYRLRHQRIVS